MISPRSHDLNGFFKLIGVRFTRKSLSRDVMPQAHSRASPLSFSLNAALCHWKGEVHSRNTNREISRPRIVIKATQHARLIDIAESATRQVRLWRTI